MLLQCTPSLAGSTHVPEASCGKCSRCSHRMCIPRLCMFPGVFSQLMLLQAKEDTLPFCRLDEDARAFALPLPVEVSTFRIVVCTCSAAGDPFSLASFSNADGFCVRIIL